MQIVTKLSTLALTCAITACGGGKKDADEPAPKTPMEETVTDAEVDQYLEESKVTIDEEAAQIALDRGARKVAECGETAEAPPGKGDVTVIFDGTKGRVTEVELGIEWATLPDRAQECIKNGFLGEIVPPFEGIEKKIHTVEIPEKKAGGAEK